jgi:hypothetical protein
MSYAVPQPPPAKTRPGAVGAAVSLMFLAAFVQLVSAVISFLPNHQLDQALNTFYANHPDLNRSSGTDNVANAVAIVVEIVLIVGLVVLAIFVGRGSQGARITTWVLSGIGVLCLGCGSLANAVAPALLNGASGSNNQQAQEAKDLLDLVRANTPNWQYYLSSALEIVLVLALVLVIILLAVPAANDYFRKQEQVWVPPTNWPGSGFPQVPPPATPQNPMAPPPPPAAPPGPPTQG